MSLSKTFLNLLTGQKNQKQAAPEAESFKPTPRISREELREFLINNRLEGELLKSVTELKSRYTDLTNYQAVEFLMDRSDRSDH